MRIEFRHPTGPRSMGGWNRLLMPFLRNWPDSESDPRPSRVDRVSGFKAKATLTRPKNNEKKSVGGGVSSPNTDVSSVSGFEPATSGFPRSAP